MPPYTRGSVSLSQRLNLAYDEALSTFAFNFKLRRYALGNAVTSRLHASAGDRAAAAAGAALSRVGAAVVGVVGVILWFIRVPLLSAFTSDAAVVDAALVPYPLIVACVFTFWWGARRRIH